MQIERVNRVEWTDDAQEQAIRSYALEWNSCASMYASSILKR